MNRSEPEDVASTESDKNFTMMPALCDQRVGYIWRESFNVAAGRYLAKVDLARGEKDTSCSVMAD